MDFLPSRPAAAPGTFSSESLFSGVLDCDLPLRRAPHPLVEGTGSSETPATPGFRGFQDRSGHRHMGESFAYKGAMGQGLEHLLSNVEAGTINWSEVYECLKTPLWYAAARGARQAGGPDRDAA